MHMSEKHSNIMAIQKCIKCPHCNQKQNITFPSINKIIENNIRSKYYNNSMDVCVLHYCTSCENLLEINAVCKIDIINIVPSLIVQRDSDD